MDEEIRKKILMLLDQHRIMTIATIRPDGWPQATTVGYVNEGLTLYFLCGLDSQKAVNLERDDRVSLTIDHDTSDIMAITGLSMAAHAQAVLQGLRTHRSRHLLSARRAFGHPAVRRVDRRRAGRHPASRRAGRAMTTIGTFETSVDVVPKLGAT